MIMVKTSLVLRLQSEWEPFQGEPARAVGIRQPSGVPARCDSSVLSLSACWIYFAM